uniref:Retrotransposon gag domain-containing protein n=1 Tax=Trichuris muris TaxID=70415 RepID=A0A5S6QN13_TRIMR
MSNISSESMTTERKPIAPYRAFHPKEDTWEAWLLQFCAHLEINYVTDDNFKRSYLLTSLVPTCFEELRRACLPKTPFDFSYEEATAKMAKLYGNQVLLMRERANFFKVRQEEHQTAMEFANKLKHAAANYDFDNFNLEAALVVQFVNGMSSEHCKRKLLARGKDVTLEEAVTFVRIDEEVRSSQDKSAVKETGICRVSQKDVLDRRDNFCFESQKDQPLSPRFNFDTTSLVSLLRPKAVVKQVTTQQTLREVLKKYASIFEPGLGHCTKIMARVELKEGAVPVLRKPFPVAFALREAVEAELQRYVDMVVITPVEQADWAAPIVIAKKPNKQVRLCADFSTGLNRALVTNAYPIPSPEDLYHALEGEVKYSKLDLSDAYP